MNKIKKTFPKITISGITKKVFSLDFSGGGTDVSSLKMSFLTGDSDNFNLSSSQLVTVSIGNFYTFIGYIVNITKRIGISGKITELTLVDRSIILDRLYIGLKGKHGGPAPNLVGSNIQVSKEVNLNQLNPNKTSSPTTGGQSVISIFEISGDQPDDLILIGSAIDPCKDIGDETVDMCDPCIDTNGYIEKKIDCVKNRSFQILDVDYTFNDLIAAASNKGISFINKPTINLSYRSQATGSLRDVLNTWCQELGYSFYYTSGGQVQFFDVKNGINIRSDLDSYFNDCIIEDKTETTSIEQNTNKINVAYFGKGGEIKQYDCSNEQAGSYNGLQKQGYSLKPISLNLVLSNTQLTRRYGGSDNFKAIIAAGEYSQDFRNLFCWTQILNFKQPNPNMIGEKPLMGWKVKAVSFKQGDEISAHVSDGYNETAMTTMYNHIMNEVIPKNQRREYETNGAYIVIAEPYENKSFAFEQAVIKNYCGRYWYNGILSDDRKISSPDGTVKIVQLNINNLTYMFPDLLLSHPYLAQAKSSLSAGLAGTDNKNVIILERNSSVFPDPRDPQIEDFLKKVEKVKIKEIDFGAEYASLKAEDKVFLIPASKGIDISFSISTRTHPIERQSAREPYGFGGYGSTDKIEISLKIPKNNLEKIGVYLPVSSNYSVVLEPSGNKVSFTYGSIIPKLETIIFGRNNRPRKYLSTSLNYIPITDSNLSNLQRDNSSKMCYLDKNKVIQYGQSIVSNFNINDPEELKTISYSLFGIPSVVFTPQDGLNSFSIRMDSSGTRTSLSFSNRPPAPQSIEFKRNELKYLLNKQSLKTFINGLR